MTDFSDFYKSLTIVQYWDKPKAIAEVGALVGGWEAIFDFLSTWPVEFDVETATGDRLDIIGKIVGQLRTIEEIEAIPFFGFPGAIGSGTFGTLVDSDVGSPFRSLVENEYVSRTLNDAEFRVMILAKIRKNVATTSITDTVETVLSVLPTSTGVSVVEGVAEFVLNFDTRLTDTEKLILTNTDFTPRPGGVAASYTDPDGLFVP